MSRARLVIDFNSADGLRNFIGWLREDASTLRQPFGFDVNAFAYDEGDDIPDGALELVAILVPGVRVAEHEGVPLLPVPGSEPPPPPPARRHGKPEELFAPHGTSGGPAPRDTRGQGVSELPRY